MSPVTRYYYLTRLLPSRLAPPRQLPIYTTLPSTSRFYSLPAAQPKAAQMEVVFSKNAPAPVGPYSQAIKTPIAVYCSGQLPADAAGQLVEGSIADKTAQAIRNLQAVLEAAGSGLDKVVKVTIFLADMGNFSEMNTEYEKWFIQKPARSCVAVKTLPKNVDIEMECIALPVS